MRPPITDRRLELILGGALWAVGVWLLQDAFRDRRPSGLVRAVLPV